MVLTDELQLIKQLTDAPQITLTQQRVLFCAVTGVRIEIRAFCMAAHHLGYSRVRLRGIAHQRDSDRALAWMAEFITFYDTEQAFVLDETSKDRVDMRAAYGWTLRGSPAISSDGYFGRGERYSALCAFDLTGFVDWAIIDGTYNKQGFLHHTTEAFTDWRGQLRPDMMLRHVNPLRSPVDGRRMPRSVVIYDNATIHHIHEFDRRIASCGAISLPLPPYCHDLTPLDNGAFGEVVLFFQRNPVACQLMGTPCALEAAFTHVNNHPGMARAFFRKCGYPVV